MAEEEGDIKEWLRINAEKLVELDARGTVEMLRRVDREGLDAHDLETVFKKHSSPSEQCKALLTVLGTRSVELCEAFRRVVQATNAPLACQIAPLRFHILWVASTAQHAAVVVNLLETYARAQFLPSQREGECLVRRGAVFGERDEQVTLIFPLKADSLSRALTEGVVWDGVHMAVLTGTCEVPYSSKSSPLTRYRVLVPTRALGGAHTSPVECSTAVRVKRLSVRMRERLDQAQWVTDNLKMRLRKREEEEGQAELLRRFYHELKKIGRGEKSIFLEKLCWTTAEGVTGERNKNILCTLLPDWETGQLAMHLLTRRRWRMDLASPLGMAPIGGGEKVIEEDEEEDGFPTLSVDVDKLIMEPLFGYISSVGGREEKGLATDSVSFLFYQLCSERLGSDRPWLACKCVQPITGGEDELASFLTVALAMEIIQMLKIRRF